MPPLKFPGPPPELCCFPKFCFWDLKHVTFGKLCLINLDLFGSGHVTFEILCQYFFHFKLEACNFFKVLPDIFSFLVSLFFFKLEACKLCKILPEIFSVFVPEHVIFGNLCRWNFEMWKFLFLTLEACNFWKILPLKFRFIWFRACKFSNFVPLFLYFKNEACDLCKTLPDIFSFFCSRACYFWEFMPMKFWNVTIFIFETWSM